MSTLVQDKTNKKSTKIEPVKKVSGAEAVIMSLLEEGVDTIFGYPGGAIMPIYDALYHYSDRINHILTRHEQGASHAAEGYARIANKPGVCFATSGPGATNLVTGIADAIMDATPMVCITGQVPAHLLGTDAFQETDVIGVTAPITKWGYQVTKASEIPEIIAKAFFIAATGKPGPVIVDITKNAQFEMMNFKYKKCEKIKGYQPLPQVKTSDLKAAAELINKAQKPFLISGHGVLISEATKELSAFSNKTGIPVCTTMQGLGSMSPQHKNFVGIPGMHGNYGPNLKTNECDVLIAVGMRFDDRVTGNVDKYAKQAKIIHIEIDPAEINKVVNADVALNGDAKAVLTALMPLVKKRSHRKWMDEFRDCDELEQKKVIKKDIHPTQGEIKMGEIMRHINELTKGEAIIVPDVGQHQMSAMRYYDYNLPDSWVASGGLGTMGFALPAAFGAKMAAPDREVVAIIGDGCFQMTLQELGTIWQSKMPVKIVIFNNNYLGMVRQWQQLFFDNRYSSVELINPDFITITKGFGIKAKKVTKRRELGKVLKEMIDSKESFLVEVVVEKEENIFPMVPSGASCAEVRLD